MDAKFNRARQYANDGGMNRLFGRFCAVSAMALTLFISSTSAVAALQVFQGGTVEESQWRAAAGSTVIETFEGFAEEAQILSLPSLGVAFEELKGGGFPAIYQHFEANVTPHGDKHLGNFPNGINAVNRYDDLSMRVASGKIITGVGYWNGDGQQDTMIAEIFDLSGNLVGSVGAFKGTFVGFIADEPVGRVVFRGATGDGWNHIDGLQTNPIPEPTTAALLLIGIIFLLAIHRLRNNRIQHFHIGQRQFHGCPRMLLVHRLHLKRIVALVSFLVAGNAMAGDARDQWHATAYTTTNLNSMAYSDVFISQYDAPNTIDEHWGAGTVSVASSLASVASDVTYGRIRAFVSADEGNANGNAGGSYASFENGWRDVLSVTGGVGTGTLAITGHADGRLSGFGANMIIGLFVGSVGSAGNLGSFGEYTHSAYGDFKLRESVIYEELVCGSGRSVCSSSIVGDLLRFDFTLTIPFEYGGKVVLVQFNMGDAGADPGFSPSVIDFLSTATVDSVVGPPGSSISGSAGELVFMDGAWRYAAAVPEPSVHVLIVCGLLLVGVVARRSCRKTTRMPRAEQRKCDWHACTADSSD
jgi:hypothetical protein